MLLNVSLPGGKGACQKDGDELLQRQVVTGFNLKESRFRLDVKNKIFTERVVRHWGRFPRKVVDPPSLEMFKSRLNEPLTNQVW